MSSFWFWLLVVLGLGVAVGAFFLVRAQRFRRAVAARGWVYDSSPRLENYLTYQIPPFGLGLGRKVDDAITGTTGDGRSFECFEYRYSGTGRKYRSRVLSVELPKALPNAWVFSQAPRQGIWLGHPDLFLTELDGLSVVAANVEFADAVLAGVPALSTKPAEPSIDFSIDGNHVVFDPASKDPEELAALIEQVTPLVAAIAELGESHAEPAVMARFGFYGHPDWSFVGRDDSVLDRYPVSRGGFGHSTESLIHGLRDGIRMDAFEHHWKTTETRVVSDGRGGTRMETYTANHQEAVLGFTLPFALPALSVNGRRVGSRSQFESTAFNDAFKVRAEDPKFASDVIHPRTMEWLLANPPVAGWTIDGAVIDFNVESLDGFVLDSCETTLRGFLARIPRFVWADKGIPVPAIEVE